MKNLLAITLVFVINLSVLAEIPDKKIKNLPEGTFKKTRNGTIVQYDKNGKKVGVYKPNNRGYIKVR